MSEYSLEILSEGSEFIELSEAKAHLVVEHSDDDILINSQIKAARQWVEKKTRRFFTPTQVLLSRCGFDDIIELPHRPVEEIVSVVYDSDSATDVLLSSDYYDLDKRGRVISSFGFDYPTARDHWNSVRITYKSGYYTPGSPDVVSVPEDIKRACLLVIADLYDNREKQQSMQLYENHAAKSLANQYKVRL